MSAPWNDLTGQRFGRLVALHRISQNIKGKVMWVCQCDCGKQITTRGTRLTGGKASSCGCINRTRLRPVRHGHAKAGQISREYGAYIEAKGRCTNEHHVGYPYYGGRGIEFRFASFEDFLNEVGLRPSDGHSLDRKNTDGHYEKGNVRWATRKQQMRNTRANRLLTLNGQTKCVAEWCEERGLNYGTVSVRLHRGRCTTCSLSLEVLPRCATCKQAPKRI